MPILGKIKSKIAEVKARKANAPERASQWNIPMYYREVLQLERNVRWDVARAKRVQKLIFKRFVMNPSERLNALEAEASMLVARLRTNENIIALHRITIEGCPGIKTKSRWSPGFRWADICFESRNAAREISERSSQDAERVTRLQS